MSPDGRSQGPSHQPGREHASVSHPAYTNLCHAKKCHTVSLVSLWIACAPHRARQAASNAFLGPPYDPDVADDSLPSLKSSRRQVDVLSAAVMVAMSLMGGGGLGSWLSGRDVAAEMREFKAQVLGRLDRIDEKLQDSHTRAERVDERVRSLELWRAKQEGVSPR